MFAVPGWAVSAHKLKKEREPGGDEKSKKRKRGSRHAQQHHVDQSNVSELWRHHIEAATSEQKSAKTESRRAKKRMKEEQELPKENGILPHSARTQTSSKATAEEKRGEEKEAVSQKRLNNETKQQSGPNGYKEHQKNKDKSKRSNVETRGSTRHNEQRPSNTPTSKKGSAPTELSKTTNVPNGTNLTPLQASMRQKLISSRFRYLNETLYTTPSTSAHELFIENPDFFDEYHEGFRRQIAAWPENPVEGFVDWLQRRGKAFSEKRGASRKMSKKKSQNDTHELSGALHSSNDDDTRGAESIPRDPRSHICTIIDLGCGDATLAQILSTSPPLPPMTKALKLNVQSFDLAAKSPAVTVADIRSLPLPDSSVSIAIFCLALMGTNWIEFIEEAYRVLQWKGECWIAEVASRFGNPKSRRVEHSVGKQQKKDERGSKRNKGDEGENIDQAENLGFAEEVMAKPPSSTDVSAFVEVLRRRGFVLQGEPELGNKMFVRMRFLKALPAKRGKCTPKQSQNEHRKKFIEDDVGLTVEEEGKILKPCVYKNR